MALPSVADIATLENQEDILDLLERRFPKRYGVKIDKNNSDPAARITYIYDAEGFTPARMNYSTGSFDYGSWGDIWFVKGNYPVMLGQDGNVKYKLNPNDYTKKEDGTASDITNDSYAGNAMARFPLVWLHMSEDANYEYIVVCESRYDETYHAYAHMDTSGNVKDEMFLACYRGSEVDGTLRSLSGKYPMWEKTAQQEMDAATANGSGWNVRTWSQRNLVNALLTIISKTDNSQTAFGGGVTDTYVNDRAQYYGMKASGGLNTAGQFKGYNDGTHQVKVFHMEDWWGNQWERIAGLINDNGVIKVSMYGPYNVTGSGYEVVRGCPTPSGTSGGYIDKFHVSRCGRIPYHAGGDGSGSDAYGCDGFWYNNAEFNIPVIGGRTGYARVAGKTTFFFLYGINNRTWNFGASLSCI